MERPPRRLNNTGFSKDYDLRIDRKGDKKTRRVRRDEVVGGFMPNEIGLTAKSYTKTFNRLACE